MADTMQQYRGKKAALPKLLPAQLGFCTDVKELYAGAEEENVLIGAAAWAERITAMQSALSGKLTAQKAASSAELATEAEIADIINAFNGLIAALKEAGIMNSA